MPADSYSGICADSLNGKVPNWLEVPSLSASTWKIMEMSELKNLQSMNTKILTLNLGESFIERLLNYSNLNGAL